MSNNRRECPKCYGNCKCSKCDGKGYFYDGIIDATLGVNRIKCKLCNTTGKCPRCRGKGHIPND